MHLNHTEQFINHTHFLEQELSIKQPGNSREFVPSCLGSDVPGPASLKLKIEDSYFTHVCKNKNAGATIEIRNFT
jgi:hypothetical protein